jgi:hypothetical protein
MKTFAGFWRDGALVQPEEKHYNRTGIIARWKDNGEFDFCHSKFKDWERVDWLDTIVPTELTPQEAFELLKIINPDIEKIEDDGGDWVATNAGSDIINWGDTLEYPLQKKWRVPTDADKGKKCRVSNDGEVWFPNRIFIVSFNDSFVVANNESCVGCWQFCEVLDE